MALTFTAGIYQTMPVAEVVRLAALAESLGFEGVWLGDSQCLWREAWVSLGAAAAATRRLRLGLSVTNPVTRHLTVTAGAAYSADELSGGRVWLGIGRGETSVVLAGSGRATVAGLEAAVQALRDLWAGREAVFPGAGGARAAGRSAGRAGGAARLTFAAASPRVIPVYLPGIGPRVLRLAGRVADGVLLTVGADPRFLRGALALVQEGAAQAGRDLREVRVVARIPCCVSDEPDARRHVRTHVATALRGAHAYNADPEDAPAIERIRSAYEVGSHLALDAPHADLVPDRLVDKYALAGRPEECLERVRRLQDAGIDQLNLVLLSPDLAGVLRTFAERVMARL